MQFSILMSRPFTERNELNSKTNLKGDTFFFKKKKDGAMKRRNVGFSKIRAAPTHKLHQEWISDSGDDVLFHWAIQRKNVSSTTAWNMHILSELIASVEPQFYFWPFAGIIYSDSGVTLPPPLPSGFHLSPFISLQVPCYFSDDTQNHFPRVDAATAVAAGVGVKWKSVEMTQPARWLCMQSDISSLFCRPRTE